MYLELDGTGSVEALRELLAGMAARDDVASVLVLACDANAFTCEQLDPVLTGFGKTVFGGVFPALLHGRELLKRGTLVVGMRALAHVTVIEGMSDDAMDFERVLEESVAYNDDLSTLLVFLDGLAGRVETFIDELYDVFGLEVNYVGGGAGSLERGRIPCLISNQGLLRDCAVLVEMGIRSGVGVAHGLEELAGPFRVTESEKTIVQTLDWEPAMDVYRRSLEAEGVVFPGGEGSPCDVFMAHPFGISKLEAEMVVRDPIRALSGGGIVCVGEVPEGAYVTILRAKTQNLKQAAIKALEAATKQLCLDCFKGQNGTICGPGRCETAEARGLWGLAVECASRMIFLGSEFKLELDAMLPDNAPMIGFCSIGEVANNGKDYLEFYNKTCVVALLEGE